MFFTSARQAQYQSLVLYPGWPTTPVEITNDPYVILGVPRNANPDRIKAAYRELALRYHPDRGRYANREMFQAVNTAYGVLSDPRSRRMYKAFGHYGLRILDGVDGIPEGTLCAKIRARFDLMMYSGSLPAFTLRLLQGSFCILFAVLWHCLRAVGNFVRQLWRNRNKLCLLFKRNAPQPRLLCVRCDMPINIVCFVCDPGGSVCGRHCDH